MLLAEATSPDSISSIVQAIAAVIAALATLAAVGIASKELRKLNRSIKLAGLSALLQLESDINTRKHAVDEANREYGKEVVGKPEDKTTILKGELDGKIENYLNSLDRLAWCIRSKYMPEREYREEYQGYFFDVVEKYPTWFCEGSCYNNILFLVERWKRIPLKNKLH